MVAAGAKGFRPDPKTKKTLLHTAAAADELELVRELVESGWDVFATDSSGKTAFDVAGTWGDVKRFLASEMRERFGVGLPGESLGDWNAVQARALEALAKRRLGFRGSRVRAVERAIESIPNVFDLMPMAVLGLDRPPTREEERAARRSELIVPRRPSQEVAPGISFRELVRRMERAAG